MDERRISGLIGLCVRAGMAVFGEEGCMKALRNGECEILLLDASISDASREKYSGICQHSAVKVVLLPVNLMASATGRSAKAMAVRQGTLADQLGSLLQR